MLLQETLKKIRTSPDPENEKAVEAKILTPILDNLGWDIYGTELQYRYPVGDKKERNEVDIALKIKGRVVALIEAKASRVKLDDHVIQVLRYAYYEGVQLCVLTNGREWWLYLPREEGAPAERRFATFDIKADSVEKLVGNLETYLSRENLRTKEAEKRAKEVLKALRDEEYLRKEIPRIWKAKLDEPDREIVDLVIKWTDNEIGLKPTKEQIVAVLKGLPLPTVLSPVVPEPEISEIVGFELFGKDYDIKQKIQAQKIIVNEIYSRHITNFEPALEIDGFIKKPPPGKFDKYHKVGLSGVYVLLSGDIYVRLYNLLSQFGYEQDELKIYTSGGLLDTSTFYTKKSGGGKPKHTRAIGFSLWGEYERVQSSKEVLIRVAEKLEHKHREDFDKVLSMRGKKRVYTSRDPKQLYKSTSMSIGESGIFLEINFSAPDIEKRCKELLAIFGYSESDLEIYK